MTKCPKCGGLMKIIKEICPISPLFEIWNRLKCNRCDCYMYVDKHGKIKEYGIVQLR